MSTEALRGTSRHQFLGRRNELSAQLEMDRGKVQDSFGRRVRHQTRCDPSGSDLYRRSYRLGRVTRCAADRSRTAAVLSRFIGDSSSPAAPPGVSRIVSALNAAIELARSGYPQEIGVLHRIVQEALSAVMARIRTHGHVSGKLAVASHPPEVLLHQ
jgi:hypothetical protein